MSNKGKCRSMALAILSCALLLCAQGIHAQNKTITKPEKKTITTTSSGTRSGTSGVKKSTTSNGSRSGTSGVKKSTTSSGSRGNAQTSSRATQGSAQASSASKPSSGSSASVSSATGTINGHGYVDLGLSVKWATCNVGASNPSDYGNYYAWGETSTKSSYTENNSVTYGKNMGGIAGDSRYDAARANWGGSWRLPTASEIDELVSKCKREWTTMGGHKGYKVIGPNGNSIFLPAAGWRDGMSFNDAGGNGHYWIAAPSEGNSHFAYVLYFYRGYFSWSWDYRYFGQSVRPVLE